MTVGITDHRIRLRVRRIIALGKAQDVALTVVYTDRAESRGEISRRIVSARKSNRREREAYKKATSGK